MDILIKNGKLLLYDQDCFHIEDGSIGITGERITDIYTGDHVPETDAGKVIDARGKLVMPGLINAHTHAYMCLMRNYADDLEFFEWLDNVLAVEDHLTSEDCYWGTMLNIIEMIRTGTTSFVDIPIRSSQEALHGPAGTSAAAVNDSRIRAWLGRGMVGEADDKDSQRRFREFFREMELFQDHERIRFMFAPHATYSCKRSLLERIRDLAAEKGMIANIHIAESLSEAETIAEKHNGMTPVEYVASTGLMEGPMIAAHLAQVSREDIEILKKYHVNAAINPRSNMKLGNGFAPVEQMMEAGINICLGTDSSASNNTQNLFQEMNMAALVYKGRERKAKCVDAADVLRFATINGAKALQMEGQLGILAEGALADVILLDLERAEFIPENNLISALVYSANGSEVRTVIVGGEILMEEGTLLTIDEKKVFEECRRITKRLGMTPDM